MDTDKSSPIKVLFWNCRTISNKKLQLQYYLQNNNPDIVMLSETCLTDTSLNFANYSEFRKDRQKVKKKCGGVAILVKKTIDRVYFYDISTPSEDIEARAILIETPNSNTLYFVSVYCNITIKEGSKQLKNLNDFIEKLKAEKGSGNIFYICGDFNTKQENLKKLIKHPDIIIRYPIEDSYVPNTLNKQNSIIDAMITNNVNQPNIQLDVDKTLISDHYAVKFEVNHQIFLKELNSMERKHISQISERTIELIKENITLKSKMMEKKRLYYSEEIKQIFENTVDLCFERNVKTVVQSFFVDLNNLLETNNSEHEIELKSVLRVVKKHFEELSQARLNAKYNDNLKKICS